MKVVLDTNVFVSGIFFGGPPGTILEAWQDNRIRLAVSLDILTEYERVANELAAKYPGIDPTPFIALITLDAEFCDCSPLPEQICSDPDDDMFLACALEAKASYVVSGDKLLLKATGYRGIEVIRPRALVDRYL